jgi:PAS domain S-box-containing protein
VEREELRELERYIRDLRLFVPFPMCYANPFYIVLDVNGSFERLSGYKPSEIIGEDLGKFFPPDELEKIKAAISESGRISGLETSFLAKGKKEIPVLLSAMARKDEGGDTIGLFLSVADLTELRRAEEALAREHFLLKSLAENIPDSIYFKDRENRFMMVSRTKAEHVGTTPEEIIGKTDFDFYPRELAEEMAADDRRVMETGEPIVGKVERVVRPGGEERWVSVTKVPLRDERGTIVGTMGISRDITERKLAEDAVRESERRYRALFDSALIGICVIDAESMKVVLANEAAAAIFGLDRVDEAIGMNPLDFIHPEDRERATWIIAEDMFVKDLRQVNEFRAVTKDGREIWIRAVGARIEYMGRLAGLISFYDITEQKRAQEALERERTLLRTVIDLLPDAVYVKDRECRKLLANRADLRAMGVKTEAEALGRTDFEFYPKELAEKFHADDQMVIKTGQPIFGREEVTILDGRLRWFLTSKVPLRDSSGQVVGLVGVGLDITERKLAEEERARAMAEAAAGRIARETIEGMIDGVLITELNGKITQTNTASNEMFHTAAGEMLGRHLTEFVSEQEVPLFLDTIRKIVETGEPVRNLEFTAVRKDGTKFPVLVNGSLLREEGGRPGRLLIVCRDITERRLEEERRAAFERARAEEAERFARELRARVEELEKLHRLTVGRELKMMRLEEEIKVLKKKLEDLKGRGK